MTLTPGTRLGSYEIISPLGSGGMGEVYRARDTRPAMAREVAIKVLVGAVSDESSQHRFEQEARAMSALSHPNIISIYDIGTYAGALYLVEELVEGVTLRALMSKGPLSTQRVVDYACAIARGLAAAHAKGITHRDLKPENVMVTSGGLVKILDFGLAKVWSAPPDSDSSTQAHQTGPGTIVGTVAYMAPEQLRAQSVDHRTDLFSLGIVLYEMLAGVRPFVGDTAVDTQAAILNLEPRGFEPQHHIPPLIEQIVLRCLEKNPAKRFQSASDLEFALTMALNRSGLQNSPLDQGPRRVTPWAAAAAVAALAGLLGFYLRVPERSSVQPPKQPPTRFQLTTPPDGSLHLTGDEPDVAISRDGRRIAYLSSTNGTSTGRRLFLYPIHADATLIASSTHRALFLN